MNHKLSVVTLLASLCGCASVPTPAPAVSQRNTNVLTVDVPAQDGVPAGVLRVTRVAHASVLLNFDGVTVLTDPWFTETGAYRHGEPLGYALADLPQLDVVLASHGHYDHFDIDAFAAYPNKAVPFLVGPDMVERARAAGFTNAKELQPWQHVEAGGLHITAVPALHGVPEIGYVIQHNGFTVYFAGDTRLIPEHKTLPQRFPRIDLVLPAINGLKVFGSPVVMSAEEAATLTGALGAYVVVPTHYTFQGNWFTDTFILARNGDPARFLAAAATRAPSTAVFVLPPGQPLDLVRR